MLTTKGIEVNPDKCSTILEMKSPSTLKEIQQLMDRLMALSRFIPKLAERIRSVLKKMKKAPVDKWDLGCEEALQGVKVVLTCLPVMNQRVEGWQTKPLVPSYFKINQN